MKLSKYDVNIPVSLCFSDRYYENADEACATFDPSEIAYTTLVGKYKSLSSLFEIFYGIYNCQLNKPAVLLGLFFPKKTSTSLLKI